MTVQVLKRAPRCITTHRIIIVVLFEFVNVMRRSSEDRRDARFTSELLRSRLCMLAKRVKLLKLRDLSYFEFHLSVVQPVHKLLSWWNLQWSTIWGRHCFINRHCSDSGTIKKAIPFGAILSSNLQ